MPLDIKMEYDELVKTIKHHMDLYYLMNTLMLLYQYMYFQRPNHESSKHYCSNLKMTQ